ncbi:hypothetical protein EX30DRAFT_113410 [Ascodesmis nigricans]|uniref:Uncharacterized protein n=1 Tax=Ascodesmis nigricans TaxID=341454 RepID=A0A4S2MS97_9PEZI|nr:hypothetical protein EX30DRAFT_113410 [Ascodesmis nigricans]
MYCGGCLYIGPVFSFVEFSFFFFPYPDLLLYCRNTILSCGRCPSEPVVLTLPCSLSAEACRSCRPPEYQYFVTPSSSRLPDRCVPGLLPEPSALARYTKDCYSSPEYIIRC